MLGRRVIVEAFLRWIETAKTGDRARAANALGRAYLQSAMSADERAAAEMAMTFLLDDPSPRVRLALAEAIAWSPDAPRNLILSLAEDQPEVACHAVTCSPLLSDADLVDLAARGNGATRMLIAARAHVTRPVSAALAEVGDEEELLCLLENDGAVISSLSLKRIAERLGDCCDIRNLLLDRSDLPADARQLLTQHVSNALVGLPLAQAAIGLQRLQRISREATEAAIVSIAGDIAAREIPDLVQHLRLSGRLTPSFLMHALCVGKVDFFAGAIVDLTACSERRVRSILATGRMHAVRALYESAGLPRDISVIFVEATMLWRDAARKAPASVLGNVCGRLLEKFRHHDAHGAIGELLDMVEKLHVNEQRQSARVYAALAAA
ncbi:hypothetical protein RLEG3_20845 [Rhizobium leguminosarum bv. trifolii WSM1689]|uniref:DUF2336 domain-containing protein n=1 Tax=Rhizobium TaxID=379 RepID=UPI0003E08B06|nr:MULTISPECIES: DUF2336 domain-containing protein [Rhizobium]AHF84109.1 hypothetical protein RLEG3_20845 [Rhizobium leguminosarum bv. trifolii WSM1689]MBY3390563.1 DUF2336 domain-containing protein [Rhizobium laguerreae]MBY3404207.1 DUF2336 domain-containing protein [Rhizobium laguerreae]MBY3411200.1 DUF2336 domain-containing protein [Rhizobium laguerreae]MBY3513899.1 DUF2336 domain-containing protein [Rhizobium laguerreae]